VPRSLPTVISKDLRNYHVFQAARSVAAAVPCLLLCNVGEENSSQEAGTPFMPLEKARGLVVRATDWSESSKIVTLWTRELGKVRAMARGGRRLRSAFENALDLLTLCDIVLLRKSSGSLDLLTEARVERRFPRLRTDLSALNAGFYVAELLADWTEDYDPHPGLFDAALATLGDLGGEGVATGPRLARFELELLRELGYRPTWHECVHCGKTLASDAAVAFSPSAGGVECEGCPGRSRDRQPLSAAARATLGQLSETGDSWRQPIAPAVRAEMRKVLNLYIAYLHGRPPRLSPYLES
jgi:DNA repair protein RecO (recombination protein O)